MLKETNKKNINKYHIILIVVFLIIGFILGIIVSDGININSSNDSQSTEINILNKEIDNCLDKLNLCEINSDNNT